MSKTIYPTGFSSCQKFYSVNGNFYHLVDEDNQYWKQVELYLPGDVGTYQESLETTMIRRLDELSTGKREPKRALTDNGNQKTEKLYFDDGKLKAVRSNRLKAL